MENELLSGRVLIDFYADWCNPCKLMNPTLTKFKESQDTVKLVKINVDDSFEIASKYSIKSIPTLIYLEDGEIVDRTSGVKSIDDLYKLTKINN